MKIELENQNDILDNDQVMDMDGKIVEFQESDAHDSAVNDLLNV